MLGRKQRLEPKLFYHSVSLEQRVGPDHPLRRIKNAVNFDFARKRVAGLYGSSGNQSVDPAVILKLIFLLFYENIKSERALAAQLPLRMDWLWFCGYDLDDTTPNHSILSKARQRWGEEVFAEFFQNILGQCIQAGLVDGQTIHVDSSMIDANAGKDKLRGQLREVGGKIYQQLDNQTESKNVDKTADANDLPKLHSTADKGQDEPSELEKRVSPVDPDARLGRKYSKTTLGYKDHRVVDDKCGIVTATLTSPANVNDEKRLIEAIETHQQNTAIEVRTAVADKAYGIGENYAYLRQNRITPCISHQRYDTQQDPEFTVRKFIYDKSNDSYLCPAGQRLTRKQIKREKNAVVYQIDRAVCRQCRYFQRCVSSSQSGRQVQRSFYQDDYEWADHCLSRYQRKRLMARRKARAEGSFADAANNHGFKRARWRGIAKVRIQNLMIAAIQNLRKLLKGFGVGQTAVTTVSGLFKLQLTLQILRPILYFAVGHIWRKIDAIKEFLPAREQYNVAYDKS